MCTPQAFNCRMDFERKKNNIMPGAPELFSLKMGVEIPKRSEIHQIGILRFYRQFATMIIHS